MKKTVSAFVAILLLVGLSAALANDGTPERPSLEEFDEEVAVCRRVLRQSCAIVQAMVRDGVSQEQQTESLELLQEVRTQWAAIREKYTENPPVEYARGNMFAVRLDDIANALDDMERALENGEARRSFRACGFGCGLFVALHEGYGLSYALDKLFHLRRDIRLAMTLVSTQGIEAVHDVLPSMLQKRNEVLTAPPPFSEDDARYEPYDVAVRELSQAVDNLGLALSKGNYDEAEAIVATLLATVNTPYGIAL